MENLPPERHRRLQFQITTPGKRWGQNSAYTRPQLLAKGIATRKGRDGARCPTIPPRQVLAFRDSDGRSLAEGRAGWLGSGRRPVQPVCEECPAPAHRGSPSSDIVTS